jgi:hypothetical protein
MKNVTYVPDSLQSAGREIRLALAAPLSGASKISFVRAWSSVAYLFPSLHPDAFEEDDSGWPRAVKPFASEAWRRADAGELNEDELYASDAQWAGIYDRMTSHTHEETARRLKIAAS